MPTANPEPAVQAGRSYYTSDRMCDPCELVTAVEPVAGTHLWVVRGRRGPEVVCPASALAAEPSDSCFAALRRVLP